MGASVRVCSGSDVGGFHSSKALARYAPKSEATGAGVAASLWDDDPYPVIF